MNTAQSVIYLCACALNNRIPDSLDVQKMDLDAVYSFAANHMISAIVAMALESAGYKDQRSENAIGNAIRKVAIFQTALQDISSRMEKEQIWHAPLKGAVIKDLYPRFGMREMSDIDILIDAERREDVKRIMEDLGFTTDRFGTDIHDVYKKEPVLNVEIHQSLFNSSHEAVFQTYFQNAQAKLEKQGYVCRFSPEDFYIFLIAHEYRHYYGSGTGLRSLMDTYIYTKSVSLDYSYIAEEMGKLGIAAFEQSNRQLSAKLFDGDKLTEKEQEQLDYMLSSGTYGSIQHRIENKLQKNNWTKMDYMANRFLVPVSKKNKKYRAFANTFPFFYKHKILLPFLPFYRVVRGIRNGRLSVEANALKKAGKKEQ